MSKLKRSHVNATNEICPEFKSEAVKQVIDKGYAVVDVAKRLGIPKGVLTGWVNKFKKSDAPQSSNLMTLQAEMVKLKSELRRTAEERDILKRTAAYFAKQSG
jgi:transposase